ncbi:DUF6894 family protein [Bradyrhizobium sp. BWA-3-5]|uniref:DUF6894 family protein n=1 Tax=Bradyrhizobium sp. BWA-3-5 TaxID=3080013 RepID=UPI00293EB946|nr:hypothetical protein [Bradyrhizobium sp. BWA-3-5]WOH67973.1 hypothetical protein RX331_09740 [Bradyrhizobium sp. BWA-3-5]
MRRYYFDMREEDHLAVDLEGLELPDIESVQEEAVQSLGELARDTVREPNYSCDRKRRIAIEVRDITGPVLQVKCTIETVR